MFNGSVKNYSTHTHMSKTSSETGHIVLHDDDVIKTNKDTNRKLKNLIHLF